jgi:hypothetical protein
VRSTGDPFGVASSVARALTRVLCWPDVKGMQPPAFSPSAQLLEAVKGCGGQPMSLRRAHRVAVNLSLVVQFFCLRPGHEVVEIGIHLPGFLVGVFQLPGG